MKVLGIDFGGTFIKGGDVYSVHHVVHNPQIPTPANSTPENVFNAVKSWVDSDTHRIGFAIPCVVKNNRALTTTNIDDGWQSIGLKETAEKILGVDCTFINDADAVAVAEMLNEYDLTGLTVVLTFGTGIGAAMIYNGVLVPNMEFGRMAMPFGIDTAEKFVSARIKKELDMDWAEYSHRMNTYLAYVCDMFQPDNIIIGGGVSEEWDAWGHMIQAPCNIRKAKLGNSAGLIGAALYADGFAQ